MPPRRQCVTQRFADPPDGIFWGSGLPPLLAGVHRNTLRTHPESSRLQAALRDLMRVLSAATAIQPDTACAFFMVKNEPIPVFRHKTLLQLVQEGRTDDAIDYLESISAGFTG